MPSILRIDATLHALQIHGQAILQEYCIPNCCIPAAGLVIDVLDWAGAAAFEVPTVVNVFNAPAAEFLDKHRKLPESAEDPLFKEWQDLKCKWLTAGPDPGQDPQHSKDGFDGHLVALAKHDSGQLLLDISLHQFNRPEFEVRLPSLIATCPPDFADGPSLAQYTHRDCRIQYFSQPTEQDYKRSPDWKQAKRRRQMAGELIRLARQIEKNLQAYGTPEQPDD